MKLNNPLPHILLRKMPIQDFLDLFEQEFDSLKESQAGSCVFQTTGNKFVWLIRKLPELNVQREGEGERVHVMMLERDARGDPICAAYEITIGEIPRVGPKHFHRRVLTIRESGRKDWHDIPVPTPANVVPGVLVER